MKMIRSIATAAATIAVAALALTGCSGNQGGGTGGATGGDGGDGLTIGFIAMHLDSYFSSVQTGVEAAVQEAGGTVIPVSVDDDAGKEAQAFQDLISRQVDVIAVSAMDSEGTVAGIRSAVEAGIPVVCYNACVTPEAQEELVSAFVQSDNKSLGTFTGEFAAEYISTNLGNTATIGILNCDIFEVCKQRKAGFLEALDAAGVDYDVVADQTEYEADKTTATAEAILTANPEINVFWSATDGGGTGAISAISGGGLTGKVFVFSTDMSLALGDELEDGSILQATTGQDGMSQGAAIVEAAQNAVAGEQLDPYEAFIPGVLFSAEDLDAVREWMDANK
ncbi:substrate-binding domain-containing protein [Microbacterium sp. CPCC 204701]|uniref:substrate-binding domain-containing protein n=1 Tax=Microbacterium sp. CPCC 204701 TaxID=2493084 RepID=UPI0013E37773|nr:substrate-binding domain-containing protein [Microbacterium sp. CPCC 204701]